MVRMADMFSSHARSILVGTTLLIALPAVLAPATTAWAQQPMNPLCPRLEAQLAALDRAPANDPARDEQVRRIQDSASRQQVELDRVTSQARRLGCDSGGLFSILGGRPPECGAINARMQQLQAAVEQAMSSIEQLRNGGMSPERENQRRSLLLSLSQNNCGPQYSSAAQRTGNFLNSLFGGGDNGMPTPLDTQSGTYRTVCVRSCDGAYFPISFATVPARFSDDERTCKAQCPAQDATLYTYRNPGEDMNSAVSISGQPYTSLANAFKFRTEYNASCSCKAPGQTWGDALKSIDDRAAAAQQGDIIVTEERSKRMQQRQAPKAAPARKGQNAPAATPDPQAADTPAGSDSSIRTVGPTFIAPKQ